MSPFGDAATLCRQPGAPTRLGGSQLFSEVKILCYQYYEPPPGQVIVNFFPDHGVRHPRKLILREYALFASLLDLMGFPLINRRINIELMVIGFHILGSEKR